MADFRNTIEEKVFAYCQRHALVLPQTSLCVAVSGGADSMALLRIMQVLAPRFGVKLSACHVNHGMRGAFADADEAFVRAQCEALGVSLVVYNAQQEGKAPQGVAGEAWARELRYDYFAQTLAQPNTALATAHTLNDQAETLLFRLARGAGAHGASGIRPKRGQYLRPLLCLTRAEVEQYCAEIQQPYITDETNLDDTYARNHLRQQALPSLCYANGAAVQHLGAFCEKMAEIDAYFAAKATSLLQAACLQKSLSQESYVSVAADIISNLSKHQNAVDVSTLVQCFLNESQDEVRFSLATLQQAEPLILERAMYQLVCPLRDAEQKYTTALCHMVQQGTGALQIRDDVRFVVLDGTLALQKTARVIAEKGTNTRYSPVLAGRYRFPSGFCVKIEKIPLENMEKIHLVHKKDLKNYADYDKIVPSLVLRTRAQGDIFAPAGRGVTKTVKKLHNECSVPEAERNQMPLLADGNRVVWLWGQGFAQGYALSEETKVMLKITEEKNAEE